MTMPDSDAWNNAEAAFRDLDAMFSRNASRRFRRLRRRPDYRDSPTEVRGAYDALGGLLAIYQGYGE